MDKNSIYEIIRSDVLEITSKVAGITLVQSPSVEISDAYTLRLSAEGANSYHLDLYLYADLETLKKIAGNMKRAQASAEDIPLYTVEFFNILGGRIVSRINRLYKQSARFMPPVLLDYRDGPENNNGSKLALDYRFQDGAVKILGHFIQA